MAAKTKKTEYNCGQGIFMGLDDKITKAFKLKADIRTMKEQRELAMKGVTEKLGDISGIAEYIEMDMGNGIFVTVAPPYSASRFDDKVYSQWLEDHGLMDEACRKFICRESDEIRETLRFSSEYITNVENTFESFKNYIADAELPDLAYTCADLKTEIRKLENEYKSTISGIMSGGLEKMGEDLFGAKFVYKQGGISGTLSFSRSYRRSFDIARAGEMLPEGMPEDERNAILKSKTVVISAPVVSVLTEDAIKKLHEYEKQHEAQQPEEAEICL